MKDSLRAYARELGFNACRIASATPPDHATEFAAWLAEGRQGEMAWLARSAAQRTEPQLVLPGVRSVIVVAASYGAAVGPPVSNDAAAERGAAGLPRGLVARYARHADYHDVFGERLARLADWVTSLGGTGTRSRWYTDTGPVLERDFAQRSGIGFIGKHTNVISRQLGNWLLLGEVLTTLELEPDTPEVNRCGSCTRCLSACPTGAITAPFQLDARRCISYLTIELKGSIPVEFRPAIGRRIFGCDDCLEACPWNRFAGEAHLLGLRARPDLATPDLAKLLELDEDGFKRCFAGTPLLRTKRRGLLRNVCVALGNVGGSTALPALAAATRDAEPLVAEHARWAIQQIEARV